MDQYVQQLGSFEAEDLEDKSFKDIKKFVQKEVQSHQDQLDAKQIAPAENQSAKDKLKYYAYLAKETIGGVILPFFDMGSDIATAVTHARWEHYGWSALTLFFVALPGIVCALAIGITGLREKVSARRILNYTIIFFLLPILYPFIQILINAYMVYLMFRNRTHQVVKVMGHDVKQFKSLEGFLESGPQFVLQSYIVLRGDKQGIEDFHSVDAKRLAILCITILLSFISLAKTGFNVNLPDPDEKRKSPQFRENVPRFWLTSLPFHFVCALFRVSSLAYFFATLSQWTIFIILITMVINMTILHFSASAGPTMTLLLGAISVFMPNGYLLYNFAATFPVDFRYEGTKAFLFRHMLVITCLICSFVVFVWAGQLLHWQLVMNNIPDGSVLSDEDVGNGMNAILILLGGLSLVLCLIHWKKSIVPLYTPNADQSNDKTDDAAVDALKNEAADTNSPTSDEHELGQL